MTWCYMCGRRYFLAILDNHCSIRIGNSREMRLYIKTSKQKLEQLCSCCNRIKVIENVHRCTSWNNFTQQERTRFFGGGHSITQWKRSHFVIDFSKVSLKFCTTPSRKPGSRCPHGRSVSQYSTARVSGCLSPVRRAGRDPPSHVPAWRDETNLEAPSDAEI